MPEGLELLVGLVRTPNYRVVRANTLQPHTIHLQTASQTHGITAPATDTLYNKETLYNMCVFYW